MNTNTLNGGKRHPIQVVVRRTGLSPDVLRVWEKRYGVVSPGRSPGGHRLYSDEDVERLLLLNRVTSAGRRISKVAELETKALQELAEEDAEALYVPPDIPAVSLQSDPYLESSLAAVNAMDPRELEASLMRATIALPAPALIEDVIGPLLARIGEQWAHGTLSPGKEHLASAVIRRVLESIMNACSPDANAPGIVVATPAGQVHEFGALLVGAAAAALNWRVAYLGTSLPAEDIAEVAASTDSEVIALSLVYPIDDVELPAALRSLRDHAGETRTILVGGRAAPHYLEAIESIDAKLITGLGQLVEVLEKKS
ncbi:MAG: MerR family transcriptional regulator [marine benthic group bacterium]|jgi:DNA-binding transcriptional MerR regulator/methylmalonyl-CoA mutase cobalamin-binding subunit|nr:MerR family transcriptional regulator [Gemmatimonadota bacterium]MCL7962907.1 MerR family transcriptional regulator [Candidatus Carthagonibacter metallireducens]MCL7968197.1 MerR family transcriptional regulator [Gemmatimonadota bacterium]MCL7974251.1 MerR family transcriptional regulator [Gemmatimonadota bacterium]MCL7980836.1 MerR family transcriptional regulator [Gemmatimonadota bacterium]